MKKKTTSKRPQNNFNNTFARSIFKSDFMMGETEQKRRSRRSTSKNVHSDTNHTDLPPTGEEEGEAR